MNNDQNPLADKKTLIAVALTMLFLVGWQHYISIKYPQPIKSAPLLNQDTSQEMGLDKDTQINKNATNLTHSPILVQNEVEEKFLNYEDDQISFSVSSLGLGFKNFRIKDYQAHHGGPISIGDLHNTNQFLFQAFWGINQRPIQFELTQEGPLKFVGVYKDSNTNFNIKRTIEYHKEKKYFESKTIISGSELAREEAITFVIPDTIRRDDNASWFFPSYDHQDFLVFHSGTTTSVNYNHTSENLLKEIPLVSIISVGNQYFTSVILDNSNLAPMAKLKSNYLDKEAFAFLSYNFSNTSFDQIEINHIYYVGTKSIDILKRIDDRLTKVVDFGIMTFIAKPFLYIMKWFNSLVHNWGVAIILLTLVVRILVLPLHVMSLRSMKGMQKIQPLLKDLREKHKDDPMTVHRETMALMKAHKANPIGGCLPMLLQIPIFFALFRVIGSSVELYQSPFYWWIQDLSAYDPYYILPVSLGVLMWLQQKITPTNMDPTQAKVMAFLPLIFTVFMLQLPSGLTLYMVVSALFGIIQQWYFLKDKITPLTTATNS